MVEYLLLGTFVLLSFYYSGIEMGIYCLNRVRLQNRIDRGWRTAMIIDRLLKDPQSLICTILVGNNIANFMASVFFTEILERSTSLVRAEFFAAIILAPILLIFAEVTPKNLFFQKTDHIFYKLAPTIDFFYKLFYPIVCLLRVISKLPLIFFRDAKVDGKTFLSPKRLAYFFSEGVSEGTLSPYQNLITRNILKLGRVKVKSVMIPLDKSSLIPYNADIQEQASLIRSKPFSRLPVYKGIKSNIVGIINSLEFLSADETERMAENFIRTAIYLDQNLPVDDALFKLQQAKQRMGIVVDRYNMALGIVTIKDMVEEIVGELAAW